YNPSTNSWRTVAGMVTPRTYHSVAILMTNGKVFVGGGGLCDNTPGCVNHFDAEIYSPPYLFNGDGSLATRPSISAPSTADYNTTINVTGDSGIQEFSLIRFSAATHSTNNEQRRIPVTFSGNGTYTVDIPGRNLLPPGYYMLFALDGSGVPSVAETIRIGSAVPLGGDPSLVLDLKFDDGSGSVATDDSQYGNDGTFYDVDNAGATKVASTDNWGTGLFGGALETDGIEFQSNTILEIPTSSSMSSIDRFITVMAWVSRDDIEKNASVFAHDYPAVFFGFHNSLYKFEFDTSNGRTGSCYAGYTPPGQWVHIAATYDGATARLYANGLEICSKAVTGELVLNPSEPNFSDYGVSGFYERRTDPDPGYNGSGVTDELDGRIDEVKVYNKVLTAAEIKAFFDLGAGLPTVPNCPPGTIVVEFKVGTGPWTEGSNINASEGDEVFIRAKDYVGEYFATTPQSDGPTLSSASDFTQATGYQLDTSVISGDGLIDADDIGQYVLTTPTGCAAVINLNVVASCDPGDTQIIPEYRLDGVWLSGNNDVNVDVGTEVMLSALPNEVGGTQFVIMITLPDGRVVEDDYDLGSVDPSDSGTYLITSVEGCQSVINLTVGDPNCPPGSVIPEYTIDGATQSGSNSITVDEGQQVVLSMLPDNIGLTITLPDGSTVGDNHDLGNVDASDGGAYLLTSEDGCQTTLTIQVNGPSNCPPGSIIPEYRLDGVWLSGSNDLSVDEGTEVMFSMLPNDVGVTVTLPNGTVVGDDFNLGNLTASDSGAYLLTSEDGCQTTINLTVGDPSCPPGSVIPEYTIDGATQSGSNSITVDEGQQVVLSMLPDNIGLTITLPDGSTVGDNHDLGNVDASDGGTYLLTSEDGCQTTLTIQVNGPSNCPPDSIIPEYRLDGVWLSGSNDLSVDEGTEVIFSMLPNGVGVTVTLPNGTVVGDDFNLGNLTASDSGAYLLTSEDGCQTTINLTVGDPSCPPGSVIPEYTIDGATQSGSNSITVDEGQQVVLSMLPDNIGLTITLPDGSTVGDNHSLGNVDASDGGTYLLTSADGCQTTLTIQVNGPSNCPPGSIIPEYRLDGVWLSGSNDLSVDEGTEVMFSMLPNDVGVTVTLPNGTVVGDDFNLGNLTPSDSGAYLLTSEDGCQTTINLTVGDPSCPPGSVIPEYTIDGATQSGSNSITVDEGQQVVLSMLPDNIGLTITLPDGSTVGDNHDLGNVDASDGGTYLLTSEDGCQTTLTIQVNGPSNCPPGSIIPEYRLDGVWLSGSNDLSVDEGTEVIFSMLPNGVGVTVTLPNGTVVGDDFNLGNLTPSDSGAYLLTSEDGCQTTINLNVVSGALSLKITAPEENLDQSFLELTSAKQQTAIFPNPSKGIVYVSLENYMGQRVNVFVFNTSSEIVWNKRIEKQHESLEELDLNDLSNGMYFVIIDSEGTRFSRPLIIKR
ncbi:LamG-like jellyroll fold domain-containing protein, partial [Spongiimicrobium sp. 3-5]|uniref:LamG-like jellyroll fold domain-containing protein n=1 Tax=Spongiimicrobium sp. 3-5 TaxID=3332596 RepID=UPI00397F73E0